MINNKFAGFHSNQYLAAIDTTTQTISATQQAFIWNYNTIEFSNGISVVDNNKITFSKEGVYNIQFSAQIQKMSANSSIIHIWLKKNGTNIPYSTTSFVVRGSNVLDLVAWNFVYRLNKDDYIQICWHDGVDTQLITEGATSNPSVPATPSIVLTCWEIASY